MTEKPENLSKKREKVPDKPFLGTIEPYLIDPYKYWNDTEVKDPTTLKPEPDRDILLIVGDGHCLADDLFRFLEFEVPADLMCINFSVKMIPENWHIDHFIAGDSHTAPMLKIAEEIRDETMCHCWNNNRKNERILKGRPDPFHIRWSRNASKPWNGTTANLGVKIGIALGYMKIVLAGCPMDDGGNWYTQNLKIDDVKRQKDHTNHLWKWTEIASRPIGRFIRSMSGNTADLLGEPDLEWLQDC